MIPGESPIQIEFPRIPGRGVFLSKKMMVETVETFICPACFPWFNLGPYGKIRLGDGSRRQRSRTWRHAAPAIGEEIGECPTSGGENMRKQGVEGACCIHK